MENNKKEEVIRVRVSKVEKQEVKEESEKYGLNMSAYLIMLHKKNKNNIGVK